MDRCITLRCCTCDAEKEVILDKPPELGFEFFEVVKNAGWYPVLDFGYCRSLCFCSKECAQKQVTKAGTIRKRLVKAKKGVNDEKEKVAGD